MAGSNLESVQKPLNGEEFGNAFRGAGLTQGDGKTPVSDTELAAISSAKDITATKADDGGYDFHIPATKNTQEMTMHASPAVINGTAGSGDGGNPAPSSPAPHNNTSAQGGSGRSAGPKKEIIPARIRKLDGYYSDRSDAVSNSYVHRIHSNFHSSGSSVVPAEEREKQT